MTPNVTVVLGTPSVRGALATYNEQLQRIVAKYREAGEPWPATSRAIAAYAIRMNLWQPQPAMMINRCADELSKAMREEYITDPQGRTVRAKHAVRDQRDGEQTAFWDDIRTAPRQHMQMAFQQRRHQILGECKQLKRDVDSYNQNRVPTAPIQMIFDFTLDLEEAEAA